MDVGKRIDEAKKRKGYTTNKLAKIAGVSQSHLREIERGKKQPTVELLYRICNALDVNLSEFFAENEPELSSNLRKLVQSAKRLNPEQIKALQQFLDTLK